MKRRSFTFRLFLRLLPVLALAAALPWLLAYWMDHGWVVTSVSAALLLALMWWTLRRATAPVRSLMRALSGTTSSYRDGEYTFGVYWPDNDELGDLVQAHRELGDVLREQRQGLVQRELLLDTMVQNTPVAMLLIASGGDGIARVVFSNLAARKLLLASGIADQLPALPGLAERWGSTVLHCPYCHGYEVGGGAIGLLGGHPMSASKAPLFADWGNVTFFSMGRDITDEERAAMQQRGVQIETSPVLRVQGDQPTWLEVELADGRRIAQRALFVPATQVMATPLVQQLGCRLAESPLGELIEVDMMKQTSVPNVYAAGDATTVGNITLAMAEGVRAGIGVHHALVAEDSVPR
ncbi:FAD-dependent oxidoreductase [Pseudomonas syringae]|uniref:FAD-dependent oxidoreductase n=1 Tax=Pseudomonas syringae TaxID=317 RepID=UPI000E32C502|nr:FAD-dependent oxidoreductase [Pseudomonas syringae]